MKKSNLSEKMEEVEDRKGFEYSVIPTEDVKEFIKIITKVSDENDFDISDISWGRIQWKGTDICVDIHCVCGYLGHIDGEFLIHIMLLIA